MADQESKARTGVILAAGFGSRLKGSSKETVLKPLTPVAGKPLIFRVIEGLKIAKCSRIVIVLGHGHEEIKSDIQEHYEGDAELVYVYNENYHLKNGVSLLAASDWLNDEFLVAMADHIVAGSVMEKAAEHHPPKDGATLLVDYKVDTIFDIDDATKVLAKDEKLLSIGKQIPGYNCIDIGIFVCTAGLLGALWELYEEQGDVSFSEGVKQLADKGKMTVLDIEDGFWQDVDTPEMMAHAEEMLIHQEEARSIHINQ